MATMKAAIQSGRPEAVEELLNSMSESEGTGQLTKTYGGLQVGLGGTTSPADEDGLFRGTSPIMHAASYGKVGIFSAVLGAMKARQVTASLSQQRLYFVTGPDVGTVGGRYPHFDSAPVFVRETCL